MILVPPWGPQPSDVLLIGEAPGCVSGNTLIDTPFRDKSKDPYGIPIRDLTGSSGFVYSFDVESQTLKIGAMKNVWRSGRKKVYRVTYEWFYAYGRKRVRLTDSVVVSENHPFLLKRRTQLYDPFCSKISVPSSADYLSLSEGLSIGHSLQPFLSHTHKSRRSIGASSKSMRLESRLLLEYKVGRLLAEGEECHHDDENKENDSFGNLILLSTADHARVHAIRNNPMASSEARQRHKKAMASGSYREGQSQRLKKFLSDPVEYEKRVRSIRAQSKQTSDTVTKLYQNKDYYWRYLQGRLKAFPHLGEEWAVKKFCSRFPGSDLPIENHRVISIEHVGYEDVYDMEVEKYNNFACHGIFIHNSEEASSLRPFVGPSGREQDRYLTRHHLSTRGWRLANICPEYSPGNPDPTPDQIARYTPALIEEIRRTRPKLVLAIGRFAAQWFLGEEATMSLCHGVVHRVGAFDPSRTTRAPHDCPILPITHPAAGLHDKKGNQAVKAIINWDYGQAAEVLGQIRKGLPVEFREDEFVGREVYEDIEGADLGPILASGWHGPISIDTESEDGRLYSIQVSVEPGSGYMVRRERPDFQEAVQALHGMVVLPETTVVGHNLMHDLNELLGVGLDLTAPECRCRFFDTMYAIYLLRVDADDDQGGGASRSVFRTKQSLKPAAWRHCGMRMRGYKETIGRLDAELQADYLIRAMGMTWPKPEPEVELLNDGRIKLSKPWGVGRRVEKIVEDYLTRPDDTDLEKRWLKDVGAGLRRPVEGVLGKFPVASIRTLAERDFRAMVDYGCRDSDGALRLFYRLEPELRKAGLL